MVTFHIFVKTGDENRDTRCKPEMYNMAYIFFWHCICLYIVSNIVFCLLGSELHMGEVNIWNIGSVNVNI